MTKRRRAKAPSKRAMQRRRASRLRAWGVVMTYSRGAEFIRVRRQYVAKWRAQVAS